MLSSFIVDLKRNKVTAEEVLKQLNETGEYIYTFVNKDILFIKKEQGEYYQLGKVDSITVCYGSYECVDIDDGSMGYMLCKSNNYAPRDIQKAIECFITRLVSDNPAESLNTDNTLEDIFVINRGNLEFEDEFMYLTDVSCRFFKLALKLDKDLDYINVFYPNHTEFQLYKETFQKNDIDFNRGCLLYLFGLYLNLKDMNKDQIVYWVVTEYKNYLPMIEQAEEEILKEKYGIDS